MSANNVQKFVNDARSDPLFYFKPVIIILCDAFWPSQHVNTERMTAWTRAFIRRGYRVIVITKLWRSKAPPDIVTEEFGGDISLEFVYSDANYFSIKDFFFKLNRRITRILRPLWVDPTDGFGRDPRVLSHLERIILQARPELVITSSPSDDVHAPMLRIVRRAHGRNWRWIADYRDPFIVDGRWQFDAPVSRFLRVRQNYERKVIAAADLNVAAIPVHFRYLRKHFRKVASICILNGFASEFWPSARRQKELHELKYFHGSFRLRLFSAGTIDKAQIRVVATAMRNLETSDYRWSFRYAGAVDHKLDTQNVKFLGYLDKRLVYEELVVADVLLSARAPEDKNVKRLSSKLFEYLAAGKFVILINPSGPDAIFVRNIPHVLVLREPTADEVAQALRQCVYLPKTMADISAWVADFWKKFDRDFQVDQLFCRLTLLRDAETTSSP